MNIANAAFISALGRIVHLRVARRTNMGAARALVKGERVSIGGPDALTPSQMRLLHLGLNIRVWGDAGWHAAVYGEN